MAEVCMETLNGNKSNSISTANRVPENRKTFLRNLPQSEDYNFKGPG